MKSKGNILKQLCWGFFSPPPKHNLAHNRLCVWFQLLWAFLSLQVSLSCCPPVPNYPCFWSCPLPICDGYPPAHKLQWPRSDSSSLAWWGSFHWNGDWWVGGIFLKLSKHSSSLLGGAFFKSSKHSLTTWVCRYGKNSPTAPGWWRVWEGRVLPRDMGAHHLPYAAYQGAEPMGLIRPAKLSKVACQPPCKCTFPFLCALPLLWHQSALETGSAPSCFLSTSKPLARAQGEE